MSLVGKTALVTGGCGGLGKAIAEAFLGEGANVVVCDINKDLIAEFNDQVAAASAGRTLALESNLTDDAAQDDLFKRGIENFGQIDFVCNSAGVMDDFSPAGEMSRAIWDKLTAPTMITQRAVNHMKEKNIKGSIVNIASVAGIRGFCAGAAYTVSKHGLLALTKNTAAFYGPKVGIRCNAIAAGVMQTNMANDYLSGKFKFNMEGFGVMRRTFPEDGQVFVETEKVAKLVMYLCSDAGSIVNGATWTADGGTIAN